MFLSVKLIVDSLVNSCLNLKAKASSIRKAMELYKNTLVTFGYEEIYGRTVKTETGEAYYEDTEAYQDPHKGTGREGELRGWRRHWRSSNGNEDDSQTGQDGPLDESSNLLPWLTSWPNFENRIDSAVVLMARQLTNLKILVS